MNIIFLTMSQFDDLTSHNIYADLLSAFIAQGHKPYLVSPVETSKGISTGLTDHGDYAVLRVRVGNLSNVSLPEKGISTLRLEGQFIAAIQERLRGLRFGLILYSTPPVTFAKVIRYLKQQHQAPTYLLLKDIFPQNAVDLGMFREGGLIHRFFRRKEQALYALSDHIGCMSAANVAYLKAHHPELPAERIHISPNSITPQPVPTNAAMRSQLRERYGIAADTVVFMYGGNMGKPQDIPFVVRCLKQAPAGCHFILCGTGSEYGLLEQYVNEQKPSHVTLLNGLPKNDYDALLSGCDVGLLFLDHRFTIPNFPSRLLSYMEQGLPVLACTDCCTDVGSVITQNGFGWWCESNDPAAFANRCTETVQQRAQLPELGQRGAAYLRAHYSAEENCREILAQVGQKVLVKA